MQRTALFLLAVLCASCTTRYTVAPANLFETLDLTRQEVRETYGARAPKILRDTDRVAEDPPDVSAEIAALVGDPATKAELSRILMRLDPVSAGELAAGHTEQNCLAGLCATDPELALDVLAALQKDLAARPAANVAPPAVLTGAASAAKKVQKSAEEAAENAENKDLAFREGTFLETVTAIAFDAQLEPTALPAIAVGWRPSGQHWLVQDAKLPEGAAVELLLGGALNAQGSENDGIELALGGGLSFPVGESATFAIGYIRWNPDGGDLDEGMYLGLTFGPRPAAKKPD